MEEWNNYHPKKCLGHLSIPVYMLSYTGNAGYPVTCKKSLSSVSFLASYKALENKRRSQVKPLSGTLFALSNASSAI